MANDLDLLMEKAKESGFTGMAPLAMETIILHPEVRDACAKNKCHAYDKNAGQNYRSIHMEFCCRRRACWRTPWTMKAWWKLRQNTKNMWQNL